jgi:hypothetical protein
MSADPDRDAGHDTAAVPAAGAAQLFREPPLRHLDVGKGEVAYRRVGTGPDVLFVHEERPAEVARALLPVLTGRSR